MGAQQEHDAHLVTGNSKDFPVKPFVRLQQKLCRSSTKNEKNKAIGTNRNSNGLHQIILRLNENIHTAVAHNAHCRKAVCQLPSEQGFIQRITMRYSKDKSIYPYCIWIYAKDKSETLFCGQY